MSVAPLERPTTKTAKSPNVVTRTRRIPAPQTAPQITVRARVIERRKSSAALQAWSLRAVAFLGVFGATYVASALLGQVAVESARRQEIAAKERAVEAVRAESALSDKVFALKSQSYVEGWAAANHFVAPDAADKPKPDVNEAPSANVKRYVASR